MKKITTLLFFGLISMMVFSQAPRQYANLTIYSENGETFTIKLNNKLKNQVPKSNVKIQHLTMMKYQMYLDFTSETIPDLNENIYLNPGYNIVYVVKKNRKGEFVLRPQSQAPLNTVAQTTAPSNPAARNNNVTYTQNTTARPNTNVTYTQTTTAPNSNVTYRQTTTTTTVPNASMNLSVSNPVGVSLNVNVSDPLMNNSTTYTQTTTTTSSSPAVYNNNSINRSGGSCAYPMGNSDFQAAYSSIQSKSFDDTKLTVAKQVIGSNCLKTSQVKQIMSLFSFEDTKLSLAKYAYMHTYDPKNYYQLNDAFSFSSSIDALNTYVNGLR